MLRILSIVTLFCCSVFNVSCDTKDDCSGSNLFSISIIPITDITLLDICTKTYQIELEARAVTGEVDELSWQIDGIEVASGINTSYTCMDCEDFEIDAIATTCDGNEDSRSSMVRINSLNSDIDIQSLFSTFSSNTSSLTRFGDARRPWYTDYEINYSFDVRDPSTDLSSFEISHTLNSPSSTTNFTGNEIRFTPLETGTHSIISNICSSQSASTSKTTSYSVKSDIEWTRIIISNLSVYNSLRQSIPNTYCEVFLNDNLVIKTDTRTIPPLERTFFSSTEYVVGTTSGTISGFSSKSDELRIDTYTEGELHSTRTYGAFYIGSPFVVPPFTTETVSLTGSDNPFRFSFEYSGQF